jgi:Beta-lactamase
MNASKLLGRLVSRQSLDLMTSWTNDCGVRDGDKRGYGYGFTLRETDDGIRTFGHAGGFPGINGYPSLGYTVAALSNMDDGAEKVGARIRAMVPRP